MAGNGKQRWRFAGRMRAAAGFVACACLILALVPLFSAQTDHEAVDLAYESVQLVADAAAEAAADAEAHESDLSADTQEEAARGADAAAASDPVSAAPRTDEPFGEAADVAVVAYHNAGAVDECEDGTVLVLVDSYAEAQATAEDLRGLACVAQALPSERDAQAGFLRVSLADGATVEEAEGDIADRGFDAQPNFVYHALGEPADNDADSQGVVSAALAEGGAASLAAQASINDVRASSQWGLASVNAYAAWDLVKTNKTVTVAVLDSGCKVTHEDLKNNIQDTYDAVDDAVNADDLFGHGTHVAGVIAAEANNGLGVAGVSYNAGLSIVKVMRYDFEEGDYIATSADVLAGLQHVIDTRTRKGMNIRVINMSLGGRKSKALSASDKAIVRKVDQAYNAYGILTVTAAGNASGGALPYLCFPCDYCDNALGVINVREVGGSVSRYSESNYNKGQMATKDLAAPGTGILSTTSVGTGSYGTMTGTSLAAPFVSGIAALVFAANPDLSAAQAASILRSSARDLGDDGFDAQTGYGEVDAYRAVLLAQQGMYLSGEGALLSGSSLTLTAHGQGPWTWSSNDEAVATVTDKGEVTAVSQGWAVIAATNGDQTLVKTITVYEAPKITGEGEVVAGTTSSYSVTSTPAGTWVFSSSNSGVAKVGRFGKLTAVAPGTCTITATLSANPSVKLTKMVTVKAPVFPDGLIDGHVYEVHASLDPSLALAAQSGAIAGANVCVRAASRVKAERWQVVRNGDGTITLLNKKSGCALAVADGGATGANVRVETAAKTSRQTWRTVVNDDGSLALVNAKAQAALDIANGNATSGTNVQVYVPNGSAAQSWTFIDLTTWRADMNELARDASRKVPAGTYYFCSALDGGKVLAVKDGSTANRANVQLAKRRGTKAQRWRVSYDANGYATLRNVKSGKVLEVAGGKTKNGTNVRQNAENGTRQQKWIIVTVGKRVEIRSALWPLYTLSIAGNKALAGANACMSTATGAGAQKFSLTAV